MASAVSGDYVGDLRCAGAICQLQQSQGAQDNPNLLDAAAQQLGKPVLMLRRDVNAQRWTAHTSSMGQTILHKNGLYHFFKRSKTWSAARI
jgi:hypothetical protein